MTDTPLPEIVLVPGLLPDDVALLGPAGAVGNVQVVRFGGVERGEGRNVRVWAAGDSGDHDSPPLPPVVDLTPFPEARAVLGRVARAPWNLSSLLILADWLDERTSLYGAGDKVRSWVAEVRRGEHGSDLLPRTPWSKMTRTLRRSHIAAVKRLLRRAFGCYDRESRDEDRDIPF